MLTNLSTARSLILLRCYRFIGSTVYHPVNSCPARSSCPSSNLSTPNCILQNRRGRGFDICSKTEHGNKRHLLLYCKAWLFLFRLPIRCSSERHIYKTTKLQCSETLLHCVHYIFDCIPRTCFVSAVLQLLFRNASMTRPTHNSVRKLHDLIS